MTYYSDFEQMNYYDDPTHRQQILREAEEEYYGEEIRDLDIPWDMLEDY